MPVRETKNNGEKETVVWTGAPQVYLLHPDRKMCCDFTCSLTAVFTLVR